MKKGFTLVELIIAIALLGTIMSAVGTIFSVAVKNYRTESRKSELQKEINFAADNIANEIKNASKVEQNYDVYTLSGNTLILTLPAIDAQEKFVYNAGALQKDYFIYWLSGNELHKKIVPSPLSSRQPKESTVLSNLTTLNFTYFPNNLETSRVSFNIELTTQVGKNTITKSVERTVNLRNK